MRLLLHQCHQEALIRSSIFVTAELHVRQGTQFVLSSQRLFMCNPACIRGMPVSIADPRFAHGGGVWLRHDRRAGALSRNACRRAQRDKKSSDPCLHSTLLALAVNANLQPSIVDASKRFCLRARFRGGDGKLSIRPRRTSALQSEHELRLTGWQSAQG